MMNKKLNIDGNKIAVIELGNADNFALIEQDIDLRKIYVAQYARKVDSVIFLQKIGKAYKYAVFEPNASPIGAFSTICGNGLKAVASLVPSRDAILQTSAGKFTIVKHDAYTLIQAGKYLCCRDIAPFISLEDMQKIKSLVGNLFADSPFGLPVVCMGYNAQSKTFIGEPHIVVFFFSPATPDELRNIATMYSSHIKAMLPLRIEVNITYVAFDKLITDTCYLTACTFERNLGDNPELAITGSCGTGSMAAANTFYKKILKKKMKKLSYEVTFPKATLKGEIKRGATILYGKLLYESI